MDSYNDPVPTKSWANNLKGITYTSRSGDHILPNLENPMVIANFDDGNDEFTCISGETTTHLFVPAGEEAATFNSLAKLVSFGDAKSVWTGNKRVATLTSVQGANSTTKIAILGENSCLL